MYHYQFAEVNYTLIMIFAIIFTFSSYRLYRKRKDRSHALSFFENKIEINADIVFNKWHKLYGVKVNLYYNNDNNNIAFIGFDYYSHIRSYFIFTNSNLLLDEKTRYNRRYHIKSIYKNKDSKIVIIGSKDDKETQLIISDRISYKKIKSELNWDEFL